MAGIRYRVINLIFSTREYMDDLNLLYIEVRIPVCRVAQRSGCILSAVWLKGESICFVLRLVGARLGRRLGGRDVEGAVPSRVRGLGRGLIDRGDGPLRLLRQGDGSGGEAQDHHQGKEKAQDTVDGFHGDSSIEKEWVGDSKSRRQGRTKKGRAASALAGATGS